MLELQNICFKRDNKKILDNVCLKIDAEKFYVITGPNGSGKSTLAKIIMGIEKPDFGCVLYNGKDITDMSIDNRAKLGISFAFQQPVHFKGISVYNLLKIARGKDLSKDEAGEILNKVGLNKEEYIDREINNSLSGGELKRIELASVIAKKSNLVVFDEPEAGIDLWSFQNLTQVFKNLQKEDKITSIVISHQERILAIADEVILLENGKVKAVGNREEILTGILNK